MKWFIEIEGHNAGVTFHIVMLLGTIFSLVRLMTFMSLIRGNETKPAKLAALRELPNLCEN